MSISATTRTPAAPTRSRAVTVLAWTAFLLGAFAYRLGFGLLSEFWFEDETQVFLIGLRHHATGAWPYFGADIVWTHSQIPGALLGLLVGVPMDIVPVPEAPFVLLNVLSLGALALLAWYICRRLPELPRWLVWGWLLFIPWTLQYSTHVINPSYVLCAAIVFFVGFFEALPRFSLRRVPRFAANFMMGAAVLWIMQIHMSWPLLVSFVLLALWTQFTEGGPAGLLRRRSPDIGGERRRAGRGLQQLGLAVLGLLAGSALTGSLLLPTFWNYGILGGSGDTHRNFTIHMQGGTALVTTLARVFSFASLEISRFLGLDTARRLQFLLAHPWLIPFTAVVFVAGIVQPVWMAASWFRTRSARAEWSALKWLVVGTVLVVYFAYWFVIEPPQAHSFYLLAPLAFMYAFYCWSFVDSRRWRTVAAVVLACSLVYHAGVVIGRAPERSLYRNREVAAAAVLHKMPDVLGHRRGDAKEGAPPPDVFVQAPALTEVRLASATWSRGTAGMLLWTMRLENESATNAYRDVYYHATYRDTTGRLVGDYYNVIGEVLQPGESVTLQGVNHGFIPPFASAEIKLLRVERLVQLGRFLK